MSKDKSREDGIGVWRIGDDIFDWVTGHSEEDAVSWYLKETGLPREEIGPVVEIEDLDALHIIADMYEPDGEGTMVTMREAINDVIHHPCVIASTEY